MIDLGRRSACLGYDAVVSGQWQCGADGWVDGVGWAGGITIVGSSVCFEYTLMKLCKRVKTKCTKCRKNRVTLNIQDIMI